MKDPDAFNKPGSTLRLISNKEHYDQMLAKYHGFFEKVMDNKHQLTGTDFSTMDIMKQIHELQQFFDFHVFSFMKFFDHTKDEQDPDNYYFEREWRVVGNVQFDISDIQTIIIPKEYESDFRYAFPNFNGEIIHSDPYKANIV